MKGKTRILFVCLGNIIRSPLAARLFEREAAQAGKADKFGVELGRNWRLACGGEPRRAHAAHGCSTRISLYQPGSPGEAIRLERL